MATMMPTWTLALSACQYPGGIFDRTPRESADKSKGKLGERPAGWAAAGPAERGLAAAQAWLHERRPDLWVHCGDSVYLDATAGLLTAGALSQRPEHIYRDAHMLSNHYRGGVPTYHLMDDHEIGDNWEPSANLSRQRSLDKKRQNAKAYFDAHSPNRRAGAPLWQRLDPARTRGNLVFLGDTRSARTTRFTRDPYDARRPGKARLLGTAQMRALKQALLDARRKHSSAFRFVATPSIFLPRHLATIEHPASALRADGWDGYPRSQHEILATIADGDITNVVFVSGDEHLGCVATAEVQRIDKPASKPVTLWSVHVGAMYAPFPFANAIEAEFADPGDAWEFTSGSGTYRCCVLDTWFPHRERIPASGEAPGANDGFAVIDVHAPADARANAARNFSVTYHYAWGEGAAVCWPPTAAA
jgi:cholesterol oxidase